MKIKIGQYIDEDTGNVYDRYLLLGRAIKDGELREVGERKTSKYSFAVSVSKFDPLCDVCLWDFDAREYAGRVTKGSVVFMDAIERSREYKGKTLIDYRPLYLMIDPKRAVDTGADNHRRRTVKPEAPDAGFTEILNTENLPF